MRGQEVTPNEFILFDDSIAKIGIQLRILMVRIDIPSSVSRNIGKAS
jgi:hypothetical protein